MRACATLLMVGAALLAGCAPQTLRYAAAGKQPEPASQREATGITLTSGTCGSRDERGFIPAAILIPLAGMAVDFAMKLVGDELKRLKEGRSAVWFASTGTDAFPKDEKGTFCLTLYRGVIEKDEERGQKLLDWPVFFMQADVAQGSMTGDAAVIKVTPILLQYADTSAPVRGTGKKDVSVVLAFSPETLQPAPGQATVPETKAAPAVVRLDFGRLQVGRTYGPALLTGVNGAAKMSKGTNPTITAVVSESENPSAALEALSSAFEKDKDSLGEALKKLILEALGEKKS
ncbi:MAG: hypothetical protein QOH04_869 [Sphingomonadales bacterium]|jgi:hypothetical protein|nr:hypothetical protein [Sphingomonadales bacterium]